MDLKYNAIVSMDVFRAVSNINMELFCKSSL